MTFDTALVFAGAGAFAALAFAIVTTRWIYGRSQGNAELSRIAGYIAEGASVFLKREYMALGPFIAVAALMLALANTGPLRLQAAAFALGAICSASSGYFGMKVATAANSRTAAAAMRGPTEALGVAFAGGSVMGMTVVGLAMAGLAAVMAGAAWFAGSTVDALERAVFPVLSGFSLGASGVALFARVGGGIFTKAADVGADLVGKVEAGIPEDDPRNPAVIADNVGDNVGDVAGMGADLFESYVGSIVGCVVLGASVQVASETRVALALLPFALCAVGILASVIGTFIVRLRKKGSPQATLNAGSFGAAFLAAAATYPVVRLTLGPGVAYANGGTGVDALALSACVILGLGCGVAIGSLTELFTGTGTRTVRKIAKACETGPATTVISGLGAGMLSTMPPVLVVAAALLGSNALGGLYGVGIAGLGMLLTLGIQLSVDAYGPIADNAGGLAVMAALPPEVRDITDSLDAVGNTTAAVGKGFAIGSAALTSVILSSAFVQATGVSSGLEITSVPVLAGALIGGMIPFLFSALAMDAIGVAAFAMIEEVRLQFRLKPGILAETETPDYGRCVDIATKSALRKMILPGIIAAAAPLIVGFAGGVRMLAGLLTGSTITGVLLAVFMANSGGAWDNAKKTIEAGSEGKGSETHKAAVVGDTVGDPFKDTAGPALNILIKLMAIISLVIAPILVARGL